MRKVVNTSRTGSRFFLGAHAYMGICDGFRKDHCGQETVWNDLCQECNSEYEETLFTQPDPDYNKPSGMLTAAEMRQVSLDGAAELTKNRLEIIMIQIKEAANKGLCQIVVDMDYLTPDLKSLLRKAGYKIKRSRSYDPVHFTHSISVIISW